MISCAAKTCEINVNDLLDWKNGAKSSLKKYEKKIMVFWFRKEI